MDVQECRRRFSGARHAYLATAGDDRWPHLVPVVFALRDECVVLVVDNKPKRTAALRRLRNVRENPQIALLVDHYDDDWARLWWVRADARAEIVDGGRQHADGVALLQRKYDQYVVDAPTGPVIRAAVVRWSGWSARPPGD
jgi:PPOX class probable F420-dependent enzyme